MNGGGGADTGLKMSLPLKQRVERVIPHTHTHTYHQFPVCIINQYKNPRSTVCREIRAHVSHVDYMQNITIKQHSDNIMQPVYTQ